MKVGSIWRVNTVSLLLMTGLYDDVVSIRAIEDGRRNTERQPGARMAAWLG